MNSSCDHIRALLKQCKRILIIQTKFTGDTIWSLPFVENIRQNLPDAIITIAVKKGNEPVFSANPAVNRVIGLPYNQIKRGITGVLCFMGFIKQLRATRPDCVIDLTDGDRGAIMSFFSGAPLRFCFSDQKQQRHLLYSHIFRPVANRHMALYFDDFLAALGLTIYTHDIRLKISADACNSMACKTDNLFLRGTRKKILIHPGSRVPLHQWGAARYARLLDLLTPCYDVFIAGGPGEQILVDEVLRHAATSPAMASTTLNLDEFSALCGCADIFVGNDSGPIHVAAASGTFVIGLYGPTSDPYSGPRTPRKYIFEVTTLPCHPCVRIYCTNDHEKACLELITPEEVAQIIEQTLRADGDTV